MSSQNQTLGDGVLATEVEQPSTPEALQDLVRRHVAAGRSLYPQGGLTAIDFGGTPRTPGVAVSTKGLARVIDYPAADMTITVEAGMTMADLAKVLDAEGQRLTLDPPQADRATLGGVYATNASGSRRYALGRPRDQIIGVSFVTSDGEVVKGGGRVVKNVAGYDFPRMITGSMGTLGIITQLTLKVRPKPETSRLIRVAIDSAADLAAALDKINVSEARPTAVELSNKPAAEKLGGGSSAWVLMVGFEDNAASVDWQLDKFRSEQGALPTEILGVEESKSAWANLVEFPAAAEGVLGFEAHLPPASTAGFAAEVDPGRWLLQAHAGSGVVRGFLRGEADLDQAAALIAPLRRKADEAKGSLILPRCPSAWKSRLLVWGTPRPEWVWNEKLKKTLDPAGAFNPGRFVAGI